MYDYEDSYEETGIDENVVQDALFGMLCGDWSVEDTALESCRVSIFRDAGVMRPRPASPPHPADPETPPA